MFLHDYLLACEISTVRTQTLTNTPLTYTPFTRSNLETTHDYSFNFLLYLLWTDDNNISRPIKLLH